MQAVFIFLAGYTIYVILTVNAHAMTITNDQHNYAGRLDANGATSVREEIKEYICSSFDCPSHIQLDELKLNGTQLASARISIHYTF